MLIVRHPAQAQETGIIRSDRLRTRIFGGLILLLAITLRLLHLGKQGLFFDEAWSWAAASLDWGALVQLSLSDPHPPLSYGLLKLSLMFTPDTEYSLRLITYGIIVAGIGIALVSVYLLRNVRSTTQFRASPIYRSLSFGSIIALAGLLPAIWLLFQYLRIAGRNYLPSILNHMR